MASEWSDGQVDDSNGREINISCSGWVHVTSTSCRMNYILVIMWVTQVE